MNRKRTIKFLIITAICYLLLTFNVFHIGQKLVPIDIDYLTQEKPQDKSIEDIYFETPILVDTTGHFSAESVYDMIYKALCKKTNMCDKIYLNGEYSSYEKYGYTKAVTTLVDFIDKYWSETKPIKEVIEKVDINKDTGKRRWYATRDTIIINLWSIQSQKEFAELTTHEMWHIVDLWYIQWTASKKDKIYTEFGKIVFAINDPSLEFYRFSWTNETIRKAEAKKKDFCSGYGMTDPFEDFSECFNLYINHNILFREIAKTNTILKNKYNFIATIVDGKYMASNDKEIQLIKKNTTRRPRDTTKISN